jgi:hypothetical protein
MRDIFLNRRRLGTALFFCGLSVIASGCGRPSGPQRVAVQGAILFDGQPLQAGQIRFVPADGTKGPSAAAQIDKGFYEFSPANGPVVGKHRVEIEAIPNATFELDDEAAYAKAQKEKNAVPLPPQPIPPQYNERSTLTATVDPKGEKKFDFNLQKVAITTPTR